MMTLGGKTMKKTIVLLLVLIMGLMAVACAPADTKPGGTEPDQPVVTEAPKETEKEGKSFKLGFIPYYARDDFYKDLETGARAMAAELGMELVYQDPDGDIAKEIQILEDMVTQGVDAIAVCPMSEEALIPLLKEITGKGIPVVTFDGYLPNAGDAVTAAVQFNFADLGVELGKLIEKYVTDNGVYDGSTKLRTVIIDFPISTTVGVPIIDNCKAYLEDKGIIDVVAQQDGQADRNHSMGVMENILTAQGGDIQLLIGFNYDACMGGVTSALAYGLGEGKMIAFSQLWGEEAFQLLEDDDPTWKGGVAYSPVVMGQTAVQTAFDILNGKSVDKEVYCEALMLTHENIGDLDWRAIIAARK